jgi:hypothetical protein
MPPISSIPSKNITMSPSTKMVKYSVVSTSSGTTKTTPLTSLCPSMSPKLWHYFNTQLLSNHSSHLILTLHRSTAKNNSSQNQFQPSTSLPHKSNTVKNSLAFSTTMHTPSITPCKQPSAPLHLLSPQAAGKTSPSASTISSSTLQHIQTQNFDTPPAKCTDGSTGMLPISTNPNHDLATALSSTYLTSPSYPSNRKIQHRHSLHQSLSTPKSSTLSCLLSKNLKQDQVSSMPNMPYLCAPLSMKWVIHKALPPFNLITNVPPASSPTLSFNAGPRQWT